jgi:hypothetical protein
VAGEQQLPLPAWRLEAAGEAGTWRVDEHLLGGGGGRQRVAVLRPVAGVAAGGGRRLEVPLGLRRTVRLAPDHWVRRWSTEDDTAAAAVAGRTLYLEDVVTGLLAAVPTSAPLACLHLRLVAT